MLKSLQKHQHGFLNNKERERDVFWSSLPFCNEKGESYLFIDELVLFILDVEKIEDVQIKQLELVLDFRLTGYLIEKKNQGFNFDQKMNHLLIFLEKIGLLRNKFLMNENKKIDKMLEQNKVKRVWIKGVKDIIETPSLIKTKKMIDSDLLVDRMSNTFEIVLTDGLQIGNYDRHGNFVCPSKKEIDRVLYDPHAYEYPTLVKEIKLPLHLEDLNKESINVKLLDRFHIFFNKEEQYFYTDYILNLHKDLIYGLNVDTSLKTGDFPLIDEIDDLWYSMNKIYHEMLRSNYSKDLQRLELTIKKIKKSQYDIEKIESFFVEKYPKFKNPKVFEAFKLIISNDSKYRENVANHLLKG